MRDYIMRSDCVGCAPSFGAYRIFVSCGVRSTSRFHRDSAYPTARAFTLIELLLVLVILGVLATLIYPKVSGHSERARKTAAATTSPASRRPFACLKSTVEGIRPRKKAFRALVEMPSGVKVGSTRTWRRAFRRSLGNPYQYRCPGQHNAESFDLWSFGLDGQEGGGDDIDNWTQK